VAPQRRGPERGKEKSREGNCIVSAGDPGVFAPGKNCYPGEPRAMLKIFGSKKKNFNLSSRRLRKKKEKKALPATLFHGESHQNIPNWENPEPRVAGVI